MHYLLQKEALNKGGGYAAPHASPAAIATSPCLGAPLCKWQLEQEKNCVNLKNT